MNLLLNKPINKKFITFKYHHPTNMKRDVKVIACKHQRRRERTRKTGREGEWEKNTETDVGSEAHPIWSCQKYRDSKIGKKWELRNRSWERLPNGEWV